MDRITQVLFSNIGEMTTQYAELPHQELKPQEVRIAPVFYGIYGPDLHVLKGGHSFARPPVVPGHEIAARVTKVDSKATNVKSGDHVVVDPIVAYMECHACKVGCFNLYEPPWVVGFRAPGFARSQHIVPVRNCHVAPASLSLKAPAFAEPAAYVRHCVSRMPKVSLESVLVTGAGTIGLSIVQASCIMGAGKITVIEPNAAKRVLSLRLSATGVRVPGGLDAQVRFTGVIGVVAAQVTLNDVFTHVYAGGTVVCMGVPSGPREIPLPMMQHLERDLSNFGMYIPEDFDAVIERLADGRFDTSELVTDLFPVEDADKALERVQQNDSIKAML